MSKKWLSDDELLPETRLRGVIDVLPRCTLAPSAMRRRILDALKTYRINVACSILPANSEMRRHAGRIANASEKLLRLLKGEACCSLVNGGNLEEVAELVSRLEQDLCLLAATGQEAAGTRFENDGHPLAELLGALIDLWTEATGERPRQPTYNSVTLEVSGPLMDFIVAATGEVVTIRAGRDGPGVSMEAVRSRLRVLLPKGERR